MGESNTVVSAYTLHKHLQQYCSHPIELCNDSSDPAILRKLNVPNIGDPRSRGRGSLLGLGLSLSLSLSVPPKQGMKACFLASTTKITSDSSEDPTAIFLWQLHDLSRCLEKKSMVSMRFEPFTTDYQSNH